MNICQHIKMTGERCGRQFGSGHTACGAHRGRKPAAPVVPCSGCGKLCRRPSGECSACGFNQYRRERTARIRAAAVEPEPVRRIDADDAAELLEELERALHGDSPWPEWAGRATSQWVKTRESYTAMGDAQAAEQREFAEADADAEALALALAEAEAQQAKATKLVAALRNLTGHPRPVAV